jgi:probable HAF family extracellular repeat protein
MPGDSSFHGFLWTPKHGMVDLGTLGGGSSQATAVNSRGHVVGVSFVPGDPNSRIFLWTAANGMVDITGSQSGSASLNDRGEVAGSVVPNGLRTGVAFVWSPEGGLTQLGTLGGPSSSPRGINASGHVAGVSQISTGASRAFFWSDDTGMLDLGTLGGDSSRADAINVLGHVAGMSTIAGSNTTHAFIWTETEGLIDIGTLGGSTTQPLAINATDQVVGEATIPPFHTHAFSWTRSGGLVDLGTLGGADSTAGSVNARGQVVGSSRLPGGALRATLWNTSYKFSGFFKIANPPTFNDVVAGRKVSIEFGLGGDFGLDILETGGASSQSIACDDPAILDPVELPIAETSSALRYRPKTNRYVFAWKTDREWVGTCRQFNLKLNDGTDHIAYFSFRHDDTRGELPSDPTEPRVETPPR